MHRISLNVAASQQHPHTFSDFLYIYVHVRIFIAHWCICDASLGDDAPATPWFSGTSVLSERSLNPKPWCATRRVQTPTTIGESLVSFTKPPPVQTQRKQSLTGGGRLRFYINIFCVENFRIICTHTQFAWVWCSAGVAVKDEKNVRMMHIWLPRERSCIRVQQAAAVRFSPGAGVPLRKGCWGSHPYGPSSTRCIAIATTGRRAPLWRWRWLWTRAPGKLGERGSITWRTYVRTQQQYQQALGGESSAHITYRPDAIQAP